MIAGLIILLIVLTATVCAFCLVLHSKQIESLEKARLHHEMLVNLDIAIRGLSEQHSGLCKRIDQLASDVLRREIYQNADDRHQLAIQSARQGKGVFELTQLHGLSTDEAALIVSLHHPQVSKNKGVIKNANLVDQSAADLA